MSEKKNNTDLELELEEERKRRERLERSRGDEIERERTIDGEEIYVPEEETPIEEDELDEKTSDEYYEDMFEEDWEEIEAAEEAERERQEQLDKKKAKSKEQQKRLKRRREEEARRKEAQRLAQQHKEQSQGTSEIPPVVPVNTEPTQVPVSTESVQNNEPIQPTTQPIVSETPAVSVEVENNNSTQREHYDEEPVRRQVPETQVPINTEPASTVKATETHQEVTQTSTTEKSEPLPFSSAAPTTEEYKAPAQEEYKPTPVVETPVVSVPSSTPETTHVEVETSDYSRNHQREMFEMAQDGQEPVQQTPPVVIEQKVEESVTPKEPDRTTFEQHGNQPDVYVAPQTPNYYDNYNPSEIPVESVPLSPTTEEHTFHNDLVDNVDNSEYSRAHQIEQMQNNGAQNSQTVESVPVEIGASSKSTISEDDKVESPIVGLRDERPVSANEQHVNDPSHLEPFNPAGPSENHPIDVTLRPGGLGDINVVEEKKPVFDIPDAEKPFYTENGLPLSVVNAANEAAKMEGSTTPREVSMPDYMKAANSLIYSYDKELHTLNTELTDARAKLTELQDRGGAAKEISALRAEMKVKNARFDDLMAEKARVNYFKDNGARFEKVITRDDVVNANYSRGHMADMKGKSIGGLGNDFEGAAAAAGDKNLFYSGSDLKLIQQNRLSRLYREKGAAFARGVGSAMNRVIREDETIDTEEDIRYHSTNFVKMVRAQGGEARVAVELDKLGLGKNALRKQLEEIDVIVGIGDVRILRLEDIDNYLGNEKFTDEIKKQLMEVRTIRERLNSNVMEIAKKALEEAGEYRNYSLKQLKNMLKKEGLGVFDKEKIQAAIRYQELNKAMKSANSKVSSRKDFFGGILKKILRQSDYLGSVVNMADIAMTTYKAGRSTYNFLSKASAATHSNPAAVEAAKRAAEVARHQQEVDKAAKAFGKEASRVLKKQNKTITGLKRTQNWFTKSQVANAKGLETGAKMRTLLGKSTGTAAKNFAAKGGSKLAQSKIGQFASKTFAGIKNSVVAFAEKIGGLAKGAGAAAGAGVGAAVGLVILAIAMLFLVIVFVYFIIMGDSANGTSVPELVERLENKNTEWVMEIQEEADGEPQTLSKGNQLDEYTNINYTFIDFNGHKCLNTNNTKEIISMAAVCAQQDFSNASDIFKYVDALWDKSHRVTYTESNPRNCNGAICLKEDGTFNTEAQGFSGDSRTFYCTEDYKTISYDDCYKIDSEYDWRVIVDKASARFSRSAIQNGDYVGIQNIKMEGSDTGYGCSEKTGVFYCDEINNYNSEIQVKLVDASGLTYSEILGLKGCRYKHSGTYEGAPRSDCDKYSESLRTFYLNYSSLPKSGTHYFEWDSDIGKYTLTLDGVRYSFTGTGQGTNGKYLNVNTIPVWYNSSKERFMFKISYFTCREGDCPGHNITYHYCPGEHEELVCNGHIDLNINVEVDTFDRNVLFGHVVEEPCEEKFVWDADNMNWARDLSSQNWQDLYGVYISSSLFEGIDGKVSVIMPTHPNSLPIPLFNQLDYPNVAYGNYGSVASHGCGITCVAMLASYYRDATVSPAFLARAYGHYNTEHGSYHSLFPDTAAAEELDLPYEGEVYSWSAVVEALQAGKPVVSIQNENGIFTSGGHFILLTGITADGRILVNDPNGANYTKNQTMVEGFANGFTQAQIQMGASGNKYWIYGVKPGTQDTEKGNQEQQVPLQPIS